MCCHNITLIIKFQINIINIEQVITNSHARVGNWRLPFIYDIPLYRKYIFNCSNLNVIYSMYHIILIVYDIV